MNLEIEAQRKKVNAAYRATNSVNPEYNAQFDILSNMRAEAQAQQFREARGLPPDAKTPYDLKPLKPH